MSETTRRRLIAAGLWLLLLPAPVMGQEPPPSPPQPNNSIALTGRAEAGVEPSVEAEACPAGDVGADEGEGETAERGAEAGEAGMENRQGAAEVQIAEVPAVSPSEARLLGVPNGPFNARPGDSEAEGSRGWLAMLDPRTNDLLRVLLALAAVTAMLFALRWMLKRAAPALSRGGRPSGVMEVLARYSLGRRHQLVLLKLGRRIVLLHQGGGEMHTLSEIAEPDEVAALLARLEAGSRQREAGRFRSMLSALESEQRATAPRSERGAVRALGDGDELIDLTVAGERGLRGLLRWGRRVA